MKYVVTGATGNIGSLVTKRLVDTGEKPRVIVRDGERALQLFGDDVDVRVADLQSSSNDLTIAFQDCDALFLVNTGVDLAERDRACARAARAAGVKHLVKLSTLDVVSAVGTGSWHARGEDAIRESGVRHTFIRTAAFMSNALSWAHSIRTDAKLSSSTGDGKIAFIHPDDLADVILYALSDVVTLDDAPVVTGPIALSYREMATAIGAAIGKNIRYNTISDADAMADALIWADHAYAEALVDIWRAVREDRVSTVTDGVQRLLGRPPKSFGDWIGENAGVFARKERRSK